ncbi:Serpin family [Trema orientale]|uniref:Serpin family n=1 Tax=Trema orientale TaxID=63057 RepID=A0A2P5FUN5_TREOI|nr:Serpin family [Trema orientale]
MDFCMSVATQLILDQLKNGRSENVLMSPLSINMMLNMVASGSGGKTLKQFKEFLGSEGIHDLNDKSSIMMSLLASETPAELPPKPAGMPMATFDSGPSSWELPAEKKRQPPLFSLANSLWVDNGFPLIHSFKEITESIYKAQVKNVDFRIQAEQIRKDVNSWVENETKGLIQDLLSSDVELKPPLCLANALYFKGAWEHTFDASMTFDETFHLLDGGIIEVPFMTCAYEYRSYASFDDYKVLKLLYHSGQCTNKQFSMYFFLPHRINGLQDMMEKFNSDRTMLERPDHLHLEQVFLSQVWIPKLEFSFSFDAKTLIEDKGLTSPFGPGADFTNMVNDANVFIHSMLHKSCIEVNEEGTEAAAVTFDDMSEEAAPDDEDPDSPCPLPCFVADHPFMFMIVEEFSKFVIFTGVVLNPNEKNK